MDYDFEFFLVAASAVTGLIWAGWVLWLKTHPDAEKSVGCGWLGIEVQDVTREKAESLGLKKTQGVLVSKILPKSQLELVGVQVGDVITEYNGRPITAPSLAQIAESTQIGQTASVWLVRQGQGADMQIVRAFDGPWPVEYARSFFPVIFIVMLLRSFLAEPFRIPSGSMMPTLLIGDFILVNKFTYGIRLPVSHTKLVKLGEPKRGDIVVFRYPHDPSMDYIKRVIGLPGDRIGYFDKQITINGVAVKQTLLAEYRGVGKGENMTGALLKTEELNPVTHDILIREGQPSKQGEYLVPAGHYFMMGDNRDNSNDSRYWGFVPEENLVGKAFFIWMSFDWDNGGIAFSRIGSNLK